MNDNKIIIFDTTLRDGEQCPGAAMTFEEKIEIAKALDDMGVDVIEAGFAASSKKDFENIKEIAKNTNNSIICSLSRATQKDIEASAEALSETDKGRIHTFISTSPDHMKYKLRKNPEEVIEIIKNSVSFSRNLIGDVEWSAEDATRTQSDFLYKCVETAIKSGATTINLPDTVGYTTPEEYYEFIKGVMNNVPNIDKAIISAHCHNDLGMATANSLSAINAGARQVECCINGLGERAGNASLEEIIMSMNVRKDRYPYFTNIDTKQIAKVSKIVEEASGFIVPNNKAIVGKNAFAHGSGIHQDGILKRTNTYSIMQPQDVGIEKIDIILTRHSGLAALKSVVDEMGINVKEEKMMGFYNNFKSYAEKRKVVSNEEVAMIYDKYEKISNYKMITQASKFPLIANHNFARI